ncbi:uncharacterized protein LOC132726099 [Ruditapes philippinarum]|uniref:uncharacterized protein LOC132726099 n=1 Tax=Ruditapes philippinarum TaxID=129788 RepID=UPI00295AE213|nr:uncharacterized protein LOC132726099 [Ruditapes philippinarum]XP_060567351.1 uncharacterized protein LOC132726099 [Ruditapes philippinarum]XP_060567353.1 uncharacterized protein LOC132726099 [Ruditapes philippinarum]
MAGTTRLYHQGTNYQDEFVKTLEEEYCIKINQKSEHDTSMGGMLQKMKSWNSEPDNSPAKSDKSLSPGNNHSQCERYPLNGTHFTYEKAKLKALSQKKVEKNLASIPKDSTIKMRERRLKRKREEDEVADTRPKRRKMNSLNDKVSSQVDGPNGLIRFSTGVHDAREIIEARRASRLENEKMLTQKEKLESKEEFFTNKQKGKEKLKGNSTQREQSNPSLFDSSNKVDSSLIKVLDQNLNHVTNGLNTDNLKEIYSKKLQEVNDLSPFKGQMSAFEISLLKGKQNLERRKSIESATLRCSPRMNANVPKPNYREKKRNNSRLSLASSLDRHVEKLGKKEKLNVKQRRKRTRTTERAGSLSPSSEENKIITSVPKRRKSKANLKTADSLDSEISFNYRSSCSPKLKTLPTRLSLDSLSAGTSDIYQGSAFTSLRQPITTNKISGNPATTALHTPVFIQSDSKLSSSFNKPLERPKTLPVEASENLKKVEEQCYSKATVTAKNKNEQLSKIKGKKSLEETVNMLRRNTSAKCKETSHGKVSLTPSRSDSRTSRRSSRSSTPNMSPIKSEILTPNSTPCSSPTKSPCTTPVCTGGGTKVKKISKKKKYLFSRNDEVLARWHDGLYYLGNILRIDDRSKKCLLRYEDKSEYWSLFKDIHRVLKEEEMTCCICLSDVSEPPNEIVLCEYCLQGFHQQCHNPNIGCGKIVDPDEPWYCRTCVFFLVSSGAGKTDKELQLDDEMTKMKLELPYNLETLTWDQQHKNNLEATYCYCGGPGMYV